MHVRPGTALGVSAVLLAAVVSMHCGVGGRVASGINARAIRSIKVGMTQPQVTAIMGEPLRVRSWGPTDTIFEYAIPGLTGASLWIQFDRDAVTTVQATRHFLLDKKAVYEEAAHHRTFETAEFASMFDSPR
jgi:hypothetical protein